MPHPKNRLKLTGDTHLPDVGPDMNLDDDELIDVLPGEEDVRVHADGYLPAATAMAVAMPMAAESQPRWQPQPHGIVGQLELKLERQTSLTPLLAIGAGLFLGWMVARRLRR